MRIVLINILILSVLIVVSVCSYMAGRVNLSLARLGSIVDSDISVFRVRVENMPTSNEWMADCDVYAFHTQKEPWTSRCVQLFFILHKGKTSAMHVANLELSHLDRNGLTKPFRLEWPAGKEATSIILDLGVPDIKDGRLTIDALVLKPVN